jgi:hypothetical protein
MAHPWRTIPLWGTILRMSDSSTTVSQPSIARRSAELHWWPTALGVVFALALALGFGTGFATIVMVCAVIYVFAAVAGRPGAAWIGFLASGPIVAVGLIFDAEWLALSITAVLCTVLIVIGLARGTWRTTVNRWQLLGVAVFGALAVVASVTSPLVAGILIAVGLIGHAAWDVAHHVRRAVVSRPYAEFCAVLDVTLAVAVIVLALMG